MPSVNIASLRDEFDVYKADITSLRKEYKRGERPLACSEPPAGHAHWSLRPLEKQVVEGCDLLLANEFFYHIVIT